MSLLFPLYLLGAAAIVVPLLLHLRRRPPQESVVFGSLMFLEKTPAPPLRRRRVERWLLLLLRTLVLLLLAFAFSRPFFRSAATSLAGSDHDRTVILIDQSASMQRENLWKDALHHAETALAAGRPEDEVVLAFFDAETEWLAPVFSAWKGISPAERVAALRAHANDTTRNLPGWKSTDMAGALQEALDQLLAARAETPARRESVVLVSDFQTGANRAAVAHLAWPEEIQLQCLQVSPTRKGNLTANLAAPLPRSPQDEGTNHRIRITNAEDSDFSSVTLYWDQEENQRMELEVAPGTSRVLTLPPLPRPEENATLHLLGDAHPFDNRVYVAPVQTTRLRVLYLEEDGLDDQTGSTLFYLRKALQPAPALAPVLTEKEQMEDADLAETDVVIAAGHWQEDTAARLNTFAQQGGLVLALPGIAPSTATVDPKISLLVGESWSVQEAAVTDYALLSRLDFEHPVLQSFERAQIRDFGSIRFWRHRLLTLPEPPGENTRVIASFEQQSPAWVVQSVGSGQVVLFLSGFLPEDSQLTLSSKFVPLLYSFFREAGFRLNAPPTRYVEDHPGLEPGFHEREISGDPGTVAVNLSPAEGRTAPFDPQAVFSAWGIPVTAPAEYTDPDPFPTEETSTRHAESAELEASQSLWKWLVLATLLFLILESWLAGRRERVPV